MPLSYDDAGETAVTYNSFDELARHIGHNVACVTYGGSPARPGPNVSVECEDCCEVLFSHDKSLYDQEV